MLRLLSLVEGIKQEIIDLKRRFTQLEEKAQVGQQVTKGELPEGFQFPLQLAEDLDRLEWDLKTQRKGCASNAIWQCIFNQVLQLQRPEGEEGNQEPPLYFANNSGCYKEALS